MSLADFGRGDIAQLDLTRPWSPDEVVVLMQRIVVKLEVETATLKMLAEKAAEAKRDYDVLYSQWMLIAKTDRPDLKSDAIRESWFMQDPETGVASAKFEADRSERAHRDHSTVVRAIQHQGEQLRSLISRHTHMEKVWNPRRDEG